jgi:uncharacterized membrane protein YhaH (DUF805 family)
MKLFATAGGANRARYFFHSLGASLAFVVFIVLLHAVAPLVEQSAAEPNIIARALYAGSILVALVVFLATETCVRIQRLHDLDRPGGHWFLLFIPFYNLYLGLLLSFKKGTVGPNRFGEHPLASVAGTAISTT